MADGAGKASKSNTAVMFALLGRWCKEGVHGLLARVELGAPDASSGLSQASEVVHVVCELDDEWSKPRT